MLPSDFDGFRQTKLEDGEEVVKLRGWGRKGGWPSNKAHAGMWGDGVANILAPSLGRSRHAVNRAVSASFSVEVQENDSGILVRGSIDTVRRILAGGPPILRGLRKRVVSPSEADRLKSFRFNAVKADAQT